MRFQLVKRSRSSRRVKILVPFVSFFFSLLLAAILLAFFGANPWQTYRAMFLGAFGGRYQLIETLVKAIPLMLTGLGVSLAFRLRFWNIGAEGQLIFGAVAAAGVTLFIPGIPSFLMLPLALIAGILAGALWAGIPAVLKTRMEVDETLTTLMMNYIAILFAEFLYYGPWRDPEGYGFPGTRLFPEAAWLPRIFGRAHWGLVFAVILAFVLWFILSRTRWGFELQMIGRNQRAARCQGVRVKRNIILALLVSGGLAGLAGATEVTAISHRLQQGLSSGYGFTAIIIAWMSQLNPIATLFVSIIMGGLLVGGDQVQMAMGLPSSVGLVLQGIILLPMLAGAVFTDFHIKIVQTAVPMDGGSQEESS